ncbi:MAG: hypothetical protein ACO2PN_17285 [Pyrobaculum sp.]
MSPLPTYIAEQHVDAEAVAMRSCGAWRRLEGGWVVVVVLCVFHGGGWLWRPSFAGAAVLRVFTRLGRRVDRALGGIRRRMGGRPPQAF